MSDCMAPRPGSALKPPSASSPRATRRRAYSVPASAVIQSLVAGELRGISDRLDSLYGGSTDQGTDLDSPPQHLVPPMPSQDRRASLPLLEPLRARRTPVNLRDALPSFHPRSPEGGDQGEKLNHPEGGAEEQRPRLRCDGVEGEKLRQGSMGAVRAAEECATRGRKQEHRLSCISVPEDEEPIET